MTIHAHPGSAAPPRASIARVLRLAIAVLVASLLLAAPAAGASWRWPLRGETVRAFLVRPTAPYSAGQHRGIDLAAAPGTAVRAACGGRVRFAGRVAGTGVVSVRCGALVATYLELGTVGVRRGALVQAGQTLGAVGAHAHLHLGAREVASGRYVDPRSLLRSARRPPPLGPAPVRRISRPAAPLTAPRPVPAPRTVAAPEHGGVPAIAWAGLALVAGGLPLGGLLARQRSRQRTSWTSTSPARR